MECGVSWTRTPRAAHGHGFRSECSVQECSRRRFGCRSDVAHSTTQCSLAFETCLHDGLAQPQSLEVRVTADRFDSAHTTTRVNSPSTVCSDSPIWASCEYVQFGSEHGVRSESPERGQHVPLAAERHLDAISDAPQIIITIFSQIIDGVPARNRCSHKHDIEVVLPLKAGIRSLNEPGPSEDLAQPSC